MTEQLSSGHKLAHNVGLIVLASQGLEKHLKLVVTASGDEASGSLTDRLRKLERRALGEVVARFLGNVGNGVRFTSLRRVRALSPTG